MPVTLDTLVGGLRAENTVLFFGSGSSIPSGAPSVDALKQQLRAKFSVTNPTLSLSELAGVIEKKYGRSQLINRLREQFPKRKAIGGMCNIPIYNWKAIYTTNYDEIIEKAYFDKKKNINIFTTDFDFSNRSSIEDCNIYKLHGTIGRDVSEGNASRIIITENDYNLTNAYREAIFDKFRSDLSGSHLIIIGHSLNDEHIKDIINRSLRIQASTGGSVGATSIVLFEEDEDRASLLEDRGFQVAFGDIDKFFAALAAEKPDESPDTEICDSTIDHYPRVKAVTIDVAHAADQIGLDFGKIFYGNPATYADIRGGVTFDRDVMATVCTRLLTDKSRVSLLLGASGVGKTTAARQIALRMKAESWHVWEHSTSFDLHVEDWLKIARDLETMGEKALLLIDDAHFHLQRIGSLCEGLSASQNGSLYILLVSTRHQWSPRQKPPILLQVIKEVPMSRLSRAEIERLLRLADSNEIVRPLVEKTFGGYSYAERQRRLIDRCGQDMFVCLKNIFSTENFDDIIIREFNELDDKYKSIYRVVAVLEHAGVRIHRQLIIRLLGIPVEEIESILNNLDDIITEYTISNKDHIYGWRARHPVISAIIVKYKFFDQKRMMTLLESVIDSISPAFELELRTVREICNTESGLRGISDKNEQNRLLRKMISRVPGERVPRHRLIRNLIDEKYFDVAEQEIRQFINDLGRDGPLARYEIILRLARACNAPGLLDDDRIVLIRQAAELAVAHVQKYPHNRSVHSAYCDVGIELYRSHGDASVFDDAIANFKRAEAKFQDDEMTRLIRNYENRFQGVVTEDAIEGLVDEGVT